MEFKNIDEAVSYIQQEFKCPKTLRTQGGGRFLYRNFSQILENLKPLLKETGLFLTYKSDLVEISGRPFVKCTAKMKREGLGSVESTSFAEIGKFAGQNEAQSCGTAESYALKRAISGLVLIDDSVDSDGANDISNDENVKFFEEELTKAFADFGNAKTMTELSAIAKKYQHIGFSNLYKTAGGKAKKRICATTNQETSNGSK